LETDTKKKYIYIYIYIYIFQDNLIIVLLAKIRKGED